MSSNIISTVPSFDLFSKPDNNAPIISSAFIFYLFLTLRRQWRKDPKQQQQQLCPSSSAVQAIWDQRDWAGLKQPERGRILSSQPLSTAWIRRPIRRIKGSCPLPSGTAPCSSGQQRDSCQGSSPCLGLIRAKYPYRSYLEWLQNSLNSTGLGFRHEILLMLRSLCLDLRDSPSAWS